MSEQEENELICEKLLGWTRARIDGYWFRDASDRSVGCSWGTPTFRSWHDAGMILDALQIKTIGLSGDPKVDAAIPLLKDLSSRLAHRLLFPLAIRAAGVKYAEAVASTPVSP